MHIGATATGALTLPATVRSSPVENTSMTKAEQHKGMEYERFEFLRHVVQGRCLAWKNILDMRRTLDLLCARPEVDADRIGCYGHSMGSTHTWLVGPHEPRLKALVGIGELDDGSPIEYARKGVARIGQAYAEQQAADQFSFFIEPGAKHVLSEAMWQRTKSFFAGHLGTRAGEAT